MGTKARKQNINSVKAVSGRAKVSTEVINARVAEINEGAFKEIARLENILKTYVLLVSLMERQWRIQPIRQSFTTNKRISKLLNKLHSNQHF
jgi:hypothetical protein